MLYELTDHTRGHTVRSRDGILIGHLHLLWLIWGHIVTLTRLTDPLPDSPNLPVSRASAFAGESCAATH